MERVVNNAYWFLAEPLMERPEAEYKRMFGVDAVYFAGRLVLLVSEGDEPWNGALFPAEKVHHESLQSQWPALVSHEVLGKWLYVSEANEHFEETARACVGAILAGDERFGTVSAKRKRVGKGAKKRAVKKGRKSSPKDAPKKAHPDGRPGWMEL